MSLNKFFDPLRRSKPIDEEAFYEQSRYKSHFSMVGPVGGGKTTIAAGALLTATTMSAQLENFYCYVLPQSSHIIADSNNLRLGRFPNKTDPYNPVPPEAGVMICERGWREKKVQMGLCDVGGEVFDHMLINPMDAFKTNMQLADRRVIDYVRDSQGFVIVLPSPTSILFRTDPTQPDPDEHMYRILSQALQWKRDNHRNIDGIAVWLSQWDEAMDTAKNMDMDIYDPRDMQLPRNQTKLRKFMDNSFPNVSALLKPLDSAGKVEYFRSYFQTRKKADGITPECWGDDPNKPKIDIVDDPRGHVRFKPRYAEQDYVDFIKWMGRFAN